MNNLHRINDLLALGRELIVLIHAHEFETAAKRIAEAEDKFHQCDVESRGRKIHQISKSLASIKLICARLRSAAEDLPPDQQIFARHQIDNAIEKLFNPEIHDLRKEKHELSKPR